MTRDSSGSDPAENKEQLSATAMFLRSMEEPSAAPRQDASLSTPNASQAAAAQAPLEQPKNAEPGEFTRMFHVPHQQAPAAAAAPPGAAPRAEPGEFTQILYTGSGSSEAKTLVEPPPYLSPAAPQPGAGSRKGFSTPGVSDSASGEGSATQIFKPAAAGAASPVISPREEAIHGAAAEPLLPNPAYVPEPSWKAQSQALPAAGPSVTQLISSLGEPQSVVGRAAEPVPYSPAPVPAYTPALRQEPLSTPEAGSVTRLIHQLAQESAERAPAPAPAPATAADSGLGEFTRMISLASSPAVRQGATPQAPPSAAAQPMPQFPPMAQFAQAPQMPHLQAGTPGVAAQMQMPHMPMPKPPAMPQVTPPKGKLEAMVPVLLVVNTFLLVLILVVVLFALKAH